MTLLCNLLGHKFWEDGWARGGIERRPTDRCTRCMLSKEELISSIKKAG